MYKLTLKTHFDAAHRLENTPSLKSKKCANLHGHRWEVIIRIEADKLIDGMIIDFKELKDIIDEFDHKFINELVDYNPTAENIAEDIWRKIAQKLLSREITFKLEVEVFESPNASITYYED